MLKYLLASCCVFSCVESTNAQQAYSEPEANNALAEAATARPVVLVGDFTIEGRRVYNNAILGAERLVFAPGAELVFSQAALATRRDLFVYAREIVSQDQERPGLITWEHEGSQLTPERGTSPAGADNGSREGTPGGNGSDGAEGLLGDSGQAAPRIILATLRITSGLKVDLRGSDGAAGGKGGNGGRGGGGGYGSPASSSAFDCKRGAGDGARGGIGGNGAVGGTGGKGGMGGTFTLIAPTDLTPEMSNILQVNVGGGNPGAGGPAGDPGLGGDGGRRGSKALPYCKDDGSNGSSGSAGSSGATGPSGAVGATGSYFIGGLSANSVNKLLQ